MARFAPTALLGLDFVTKRVQGYSDLATRLIDPLSDLRRLVDGDAGGDEDGCGDYDACCDTVVSL